MNPSTPCGAARTAPLDLRLEQSCVDHLLWRCDLPDEVDLVGLAAALDALGCQQKGAQSPLPLYVTFTPDAHRIMIVQTTRRTQVRVHYETPKAERVAAAVQVAELLDRACREATSER